MTTHEKLDLHVQRTNYLAYCQMNFNLVNHPSPIGNGWEILNGKCRPLRHTLPPLPQQLTQLGSSDESDDDSSTDDDQSEQSEYGASTDSDSE